MTSWKSWNAVRCFLPLRTWAVCTLKRTLTSMKPQSHWSPLATHGMPESNMWTLGCTLSHKDTRFWISMGLVKGLAVSSFQIVNYTKRRLCCSLNVISRFDKCYLGNTTGVTFSCKILRCAEVKALHSLCLSTQTDIMHTQRLFSSMAESSISKQAEMCF